MRLGSSAGCSIDTNRNMPPKTFFCCVVFLFTSVIFSVTEANGTFYQVQFSPSRDRRTINCDINVRDAEGWIYSPDYPSKYGRYRSCNYVVERYSKDVCEVKLTVKHFDVHETPRCSSDYLELQDDQKRYKMCGTLEDGAKKFVYFPTGSGTLNFKFRSTNYNDARGFSIQVKQLRHSCSDAPQQMKGLPMTSCSHDVRGHTGRITSPGSPKNYGPGEQCVYTIHRSDSRACRVELDFRKFDLELSTGCHKDFLLLPDGTRLCGTVGAIKRILMFPSGVDYMVLMFSSDNQGGSGRGFDIQVNQLPGPCSAEHAKPQGRQCDQLINGTSGTFTSPGYPHSFGPNHRCTYNVFRPDPSVCHLQLDFAFFDIGGHNPRSCASGAYFELPGRIRRCQVFTGRKQLEVMEFQDPVQFHFVSDSYGSGRGFKIHVTQIPNTCKNYEKGLPMTACDQELIGHSVRITSPGFPGNYRPGERCIYTIHKSESSVCQVELDFRIFDVEYTAGCHKDFLMLPDETRLCGSAQAAKKTLLFPPGENRIKLMFSSDSDGRTGSGFDLQVHQIPGSCYAEHKKLPGHNCDQQLIGESGTFTSPGYPSLFGPNQYCNYILYRSDPSVCRLQLDVAFFDLGPHNPDGCSPGAYFEIPGGTRLCDVFTGRKVLGLPESSDPVAFKFVSDFYSTGRGFKIHVTQIRNTCKGYDKGDSKRRVSVADLSRKSSFNAYFTNLSRWTHGLH